MKHIRDPVTGRCAVCESNGVDPSVLHNGIFYPDSNNQKPSPRPQKVNVQEESFQPSPRPQRRALAENSQTYPIYGGGSPGKPPSVTTQSVTSTASASQVTFATQTSFVDDGSPPGTPPPRRRERRHREGSPRYSPEGSSSRMRNSDSRFKEPQVWFIGEGPGRTRRERSPSPVRREKQRSPSPERKRKPRERTPSPDNRRRDYNDRWRRDKPYDKAPNRDTSYYKNRSYTRDHGYTKSSGRRPCCRRCTRGCRRWCSWRRCCTVFWITVLILLALAALATAIYFAVAGAANESSVTDITLLKDPRYLIYGVDRPCRTTVITSPTTSTTTKTTPTTADPGTTAELTTTTTQPTTTLILCYDTTTSVVRSGSEFRNEAQSLSVTSSLMLCLAVTMGFLTGNFMERIPI